MPACMSRPPPWPTCQAADPGVYSGYQEVRLQEAAACLGLGEPPASLTVVLQVCR